MSGVYPNNCGPLEGLNGWNASWFICQRIVALNAERISHIRIHPVDQVQ